MTDVTALPAHDLIDAYRARSLSPVEVIDAVAERIAATAHLNAFWHLRVDAARREAERAEQAYGRGRTSPLLGVPVAIKDLFDTADEPTTYGSAMYRGNRPAADADAVAALRRAGAIVVGKTATHEFAYGITTNNPHFGPARNPHAPDRIPGGSSGGSGVAVGGSIVPIALGSDTSGSIRIPATFCGCVGIRPTHGAVSLRGAFPLAASLDTVGPLTRDAGDALLALDVLLRGAPGHARIAPGALPARALRVGVVAEGWPIAPAPPMARALDQARDALAAAGCHVQDVVADGLTTASDFYSAVLLPEARRTHERLGLWPARRSEYGADVQVRLGGADAIGYDAHLDAVAARHVLTDAIAASLRRVDVLLTPASAVTAVPIEGCDTPLHEGRPVPIRDLVLPFCVAQSLAGVPVASVPVGVDADGLPTAVHLTGARGDDRRVLRAAAALERALRG